MDERESLQDTVQPVEQATNEAVKENEATETSQVSETTAAQKKQNALHAVFSWVDDLVFYFAVFMLIMSFLIRPVVVNGISMMNTLNHTDVLLLSGFLYTPDYGDIVVISNDDNGSEPIIKRVIGLSGDVITVDYETYTVYRNGEPLTEEYARVDPQKGFGEMSDHTQYPVTVPENCVFVMGDNRGNSKDSRQVGMLSSGQILGKVLFRVYHNTEKFGGSILGFVE